MLPMASEHSWSVKGIHVPPPFSDFHTPPCAPPTYMVLEIVGWIAIATRRPVDWMLMLMRSGPIGVHVAAAIAGAPRSCAGHRASACRLAACNALGGMRLKGYARC